jgi:hypothetical protein
MTTMDHRCRSLLQIQSTAYPPDRAEEMLGTLLEKPALAISVR